MEDKIPWTREEVGEIKSLADLPRDAHGFVYVIIYEDETFYIGKKDLYKKVTLPALKSGEKRVNSIRVGKNKAGRRVFFDELQKESDWLTYEGSSEVTKDLVIKSKLILEIAYSKRELTYLEVKRLFVEEALEDDRCHNLCILNNFFKGNIH